MSSESEIRSRYLALALDARKVIDALILFVDQGKRQEGLDESLRDVIDSLKAPAAEDVFSPLRNRLAFSEYYEQVQALRPEEMKQIVARLQTVQSKDAGVQKQKKDAFEAIKLLTAIESRALHFYTPQP
jgi:hypothetical protein